MSKGNHTAADKAIILYGLIEALNEMDPLENSEEALLAFTSVLSQARSMAQSLHKELEQQLE